MKTYPTSYKVAILGVLAMAAIICPKSARADLGLPYASFCTAWHSKGQIMDDGIQWINPDSNRTDLTVIFKNNKAVCVFYSFRPNTGFYIAESELWRLLIANAPQGVTWKEYSREDNSRDYVSSDGLLLAKIMHEGQVLRIAYRTYLERHNLIDPNPADSGAPPVEEGGTNPSIPHDHKELGSPKGGYNL